MYKGKHDAMNVIFILQKHYLFQNNQITFHLFFPPFFAYLGGSFFLFFSPPVEVPLLFFSILYYTLAVYSVTILFALVVDKYGILLTIYIPFEQRDNTLFASFCGKIK